MFPLVGVWVTREQCRGQTSQMFWFHFYYCDLKNQSDEKQLGGEGDSLSTPFEVAVYSRDVKAART